MPQIKIKQAGKGRPIIIDVEQELERFTQQLPKVKMRLQQIRQTTSGERSEAILGSETSLPKSIEATYDVLQALKEGQQINIDTAKELRENLTLIKELASKQERVYGRALAKTFTSEYFKDIEYASKSASNIQKQILSKLKTNVQQLTPRQQQSFFTSRAYQNVKTNQGNYQKVVAWAENDIKSRTGEDVQLTTSEALSYVELQKQSQFIGGL